VVPVVALNAVAAFIRDPASVDAEGWWIVDDPGEGFVFGCRVESDAMEPLIPEGAYALFCVPPGAGPRGAMVLRQSRAPDASPDGASPLLRRIASQKTLARGTLRVSLRAQNESLVPQVFIVDEDDDLRPLARFVRLLR
jgi:hypothetical protein